MRDLTAAYEILREFEKGPDGKGPALTPYRCPAGVLTIGYGHTKDVRPTMKITRKRADQLLAEDVAEFSEAVEAATAGVPTTDAQHCALVCFAFNYGAWRTSTALKRHKAGDPIGAAKAFGLVVKARNAEGKKVELRGLVRRRAAEAALYMSDDGAPDHQRTRAADAEGPPPLAASKTVTGGVVSVLGTAGAMAAPYLTDAQSVLEPLAGYSDTIRNAFLFVALGAGVAVICVRAWDRMKGRK
jgi:lysozyme